nr:hypothetical protein [uncultured Bacteroides sp.]
MKYIRLIMAVALTFLVCSAFTMKKDKDKEKPVYVFGVAASFSDTLVYYTDIQLLDSVVLDKSGFLPQRDMYSYQLKNHLEYKLGKQNYTCIIYFSDNKKKLEKEASKVKSGYQKGKQTLLGIEPSEFKFEKPEE